MTSPAKPDSPPETMSTADAAFLTSCLRNSDGTVNVKIDAVAQAFGHSNPKSAMNRLAQLKRRYNLPMLTGGLSSNSKALNPNAISSGGPATPASDRVTRYAARSMKKGTARVVKKPKGGSAKKEKVKDKETISYKDVKEETEDLGSTTDEDEPIPTDENGKIFPNLGAGGQVTRASSRSSTKLEVDDSTKDDFDSVDDETATLAAAEFLLNAAATDTE